MDAPSCSQMTLSSLAEVAELEDLAAVVGTAEPNNFVMAAGIDTDMLEGQKR